MVDQNIETLKIIKSEETPGSTRKNNSRKKAYGITVGIMAVLFLLWFGYIHLMPAVSVKAVTVSRIYPSQTFTTLNASGYVVAQRKAALASKTTGRLVSLTVSEGDRVTKGQIVARLENDDTQANVQQADANLGSAVANLEQAKAELRVATLAHNRNKNLLEGGFVSRSEYDNSEARYLRAIAAVQAAESSIKASTAARQAAFIINDYSMIKAPFDGIVMTKNADLGDIITPLGAAANAKAAVITIADMNSLQVETDVSESNLGLVRPGQPCDIQIDAIPDKRFKGVVQTIVPTADRSKASVMVKVSFQEKDSRILPELSAKVAFLSRPAAKEEQRPFVAVNEKAVISRGRQKTVFLIRGDRVVIQEVTTGTRFGEMIEITAGLKVGDKIAITSLDRLRDNARIKMGEK